MYSARIDPSSVSPLPGTLPVVADKVLAQPKRLLKKRIDIPKTLEWAEKKTLTMEDQLVNVKDGAKYIKQALAEEEEGGQRE